MKTLWKSALLAGAAWSAVTGVAYAQSAPSGDNSAGSVEEVVVTARRREENLKDVPVAVSAISAARLEQAGAVDITALQQQTPNATVQVARGSNSTLISFIRGVGQQDPLWGFEPGVGLYIDDVYVARPQGAVLDIFDIQRIEVLRGPQGTLYGRNTIGGAIKYVTKRLDLTKPTLMAKGTVGSYSERDGVLTGSVPLGDTFAVGGAVAVYKHDGYGHNLTTGADQYNKDVKAYRASAEWTPTAATNFRLAYDKVEDDSNPRHGHRELNGINASEAVLSNVYDTRAGVGDHNKVTTEGYSFTAQHQFSDAVTGKSITAYRKGHTDTVIDFDGAPAPTLDVPAFYADEQFTQEFQLQFNTDRLQGVAGVFYLNGASKGAFDTIAGNLGVAIADAGKVATTSMSYFGDFSYDISSKLKVSVGARWTRDDKNANVFRAFYLGAYKTPILGGTPRAIYATRTNYTAAKSFEKFTPRVSVSYDFNDDLTGYVSYNEGFKSGGWDMRGDAFLVPQTVNGYEPETVKTYEAGLKGFALDRMVSFSSAVFYSDYKNQQITTQQVANPASLGIASVVDNAGASTIYGAEFEGNARLTDHFSANLSLGYLHAQFDKFVTNITGTPTDISGTRAFQNAPHWQNYASVTYRTGLMGGTFRLTPSLSYRSTFHLFDAADPILDQSAYTLFDVAAIWDSADGHWQASLIGRNLGDERYRVGGYNFNAATYDYSVIGFYGPPRTVTASLQYKF